MDYGVWGGIGGSVGVLSGTIEPIQGRGIFGRLEEGDRRLRSSFIKINLLI